MGCERPVPIGFVVDLRQGAEEGVVSVVMEIRDARAGGPIPLTSFVQEEALRLDDLQASQGGTPLAVERTRDDRGFARVVLGAPSRTGAVTVRYVVRPGAAEEAAMSGPTGYRFGWLDRTFALLGARQVFLLPMEPAPPEAIEVRLLTPSGWTIAAPWPVEGDAFSIRGGDAAARLVQGTLGAGELETAGTEGLRLAMPRQLPDPLRRQAARRAGALDRFLAEHLGPSEAPFLLILAPPAPDGSLLSVAPGPRSFGLSLREGVPTRWLSIARMAARARLADRTADARIAGSSRWILEALPLHLATAFSEADGWRTRHDWLERFYFEAAGLSIDLGRPDHVGDAPDALRREWRGALVLATLSDAMSRAGLGTVKDRLRVAAAGVGPLDPDRILVRPLPADLRAGLDRWLSPAPYSIPFPGLDENATAARLTVVPEGAGADDGGGAVVGLYLGGRNLGMLEECGCRSGQAGGMARRATLIKTRLRGPVPSLAFELGDVVPFDLHSPQLDRQTTDESDMAIDLHRYAGEAASVVSHAEVSYGPEYLRERVSRLPGGFRLVSANVSAPGLDLPPFFERRIGGVTIRVIGLYDPRSYHLGRALEHEDAAAGFRVEDPVAALRRVAAAPGDSRPTLVMVAGSIGPTTVLELHREFPDLAAILTTDYFHLAQDPRFEFERPLGESLSTVGFLGRTLLVLLRTDSYAVARLTLRLDGAGRIAAASVEDVVLDEAIPEDPIVRGRLDAHYARLAAESGLQEPAPVGSALTDRLDATYVGSEACASCHEEEQTQWATTAHATAYATLLARRRQGVPGCEACHVTGYRQPGGYRRTSDRALRNVQCESCHGPGSRHLADQGPDSIVRVPPAWVCFECHNEEHSEMSDANFEDYHARIVHARRAADQAGASPGLSGSGR